MRCEAAGVRELKVRRITSAFENPLELGRDDAQALARKCFVWRCYTASLANASKRAGSISFDCALSTGQVC